MERRAVGELAQRSINEELQREEKPERRKSGRDQVEPG
jgi:hypothetical protein